MKLYSYFQSSAAYRVRIALNLKGLKPELAFINLFKGEQRTAEYAKISPFMIVPTLVDHGQPLTQSLAIMEYLDEAYPTPALLPHGALERAHVRSLALQIACDVTPLGNLKVRKYLSGTWQFSEHATAEWTRHWIANGLAGFDSMLAASPYTGTFCHGDTPTMADCCLMPQLFNAQRWKCDLAPYPLIRHIAQACETHPAFIAAHPANQPDAIAS